MGFLDGAATGLLGGAMSMIGANAQNQANARQAQAQMDFQRNMSDTAHQREVADLKAAGLNPILSANGGASSPGGAMAQMQNVLGQGVNSAMQSMQLKKDLEAQDSQIQLNKAATTAKLADTALTQHQAKTVKMANDITSAGLDKRKEAEQFKAEGDWKHSMIDSSDSSVKMDSIGDRLRAFIGIGSSAKSMTK